jgi:putative transcriptional regulator
MANIVLRLPVLRAERRLSQRQLAAQAGLRPDTVSAMERGDTSSIRFDTLARLCEVLDCAPGDLFELEEDFHAVPVLGGDDEDEIIRQRLADPGRRVDGPTFTAELLKIAGHGSAEARRRRAAD